MFVHAHTLWVLCLPSFNSGNVWDIEVLKKDCLVSFSCSFGQEVLHSTNSWGRISVTFPFSLVSVTCLFHSRLEKSWQVFTDKSAFFMQFTGHHCNLLVTKPVPRFPVQHPIPVCNHSTLMTSSCNHSPDNFSAKVFAFNLKATGGRYWRLEKDSSLLDIDGKTFLQPDLCKHFEFMVSSQRLRLQSNLIVTSWVSRSST